jgi:hypothetical protein
VFPRQKLKRSRPSSPMPVQRSRSSSFSNLRLQRAVGQIFLPTAGCNSRPWSCVKDSVLLNSIKV